MYSPQTIRNGDGLPNEWEESVGLNPECGIGGGYQDSDGDWYSDLSEYQAGTDPLDADSDDDGLIDAVETGITRTNPKQVDSDDDGIPDLETIASLNGAQAYLRHDGHFMSTWSTVGNSAQLSGLLATVRNSYVSYKLENPIAGMHQLSLPCFMGRRESPHE